MESSEPSSRAEGEHVGAAPEVERVHLLDGTYELFRSYFGVPSRRGPDGTEIGAVSGLIASTLSLLRDPEVTHLAVATDHVIESFRNALFAGYKTSAGVPEDLLAQFPIAEDALRALGVVVWPMVEFEADDALATAAHRFAGSAGRVVVLSPDKDLAQCVTGDHVVTRDRMRNVTYDEAAVRLKFGVDPPSIPDFLALVGDAADGVPGISGWGRKSAAAVLSLYRHIESIPSAAADWQVALRNREQLAWSLSSQRSEALLFRTLTTLRTDVPLSEELADLHWRGVPTRHYLELCTRYGLRDLSERPHRWLGA